MKMKVVLVVLLMASVALPLIAQTGFDFVNQDISEIVYALSLTRKFPIVCDDTVQGTGSFRYAGGDFDTAFDSFLLSNRLYVQKESGRWIVSRLKVTFDDRNQVTLDASDVLPERIFEELSLKSDSIVLWESLPQVPVTIHTANVSVEDVCKQILSRFSGFQVEQCGSALQITQERTVSGSFAGASSYGGWPLYQEPDEEDAVRITVNESGLYTVQTHTAPFGSFLEKLHAESGIQYTSTVPEQCRLSAVSIENRSLASVLDLLCAGAGITWKKIDGMYTFSVSTEPVCAPYVISLSSVSADRFLDRLPVVLDRTQFSRTGTDHTVFFFGDETEYQLIQSLLPELDVPEERLTYDLLIIQTQKNKAASFGLTSLATTLQPGDRSKIAAAVSPGLDCNIDIAGLFGLTFAEKLQAAITDNVAEIFADTRLYGISGVPISFRNTSTYRYRDPYFSSDTGNKVDTGITREIVSGLVLNITGAVAGDGSVTTEVTASFSRQGIQDASAKGNPPATSEKVITTRVRGQSGEVIVLSGLIQDDSTVSESRVPLLGNIPVLKWFFEQEEKTTEKNEMVIYLIPHIDGGEQ